ncbi:hypothetical protein D3C78_1286970 [compost metagenome]
MAVGHFEIVFIHYVVQQFGPLIVVNAHALLLEHRVTRHKVHMQTGSQRNRPQWAMRSQRHIIGLRHGGNLEAFGDATGMRQIRLNNRQAAIGQHPFEIKTRIHTFTGGNRDMRLRRQARIVLCLFRQHRLFNKQRAVRLQLFDQDFCHRRIDATMEIQTELDTVTKGFADLRHHRHRSIHLARTVDNAHLFATVQLKGIEADFRQLVDTGNHVRRTIAAHPAIRLDFVTHQTAQ